MASGSKSTDFSHSMTDLMASVAVTFLLIAAIFILKAADANKEARAKFKGVADTQQESLDAIQLLLKDLSAQPALAGLVQHDSKDDPFVVTIEFPQRELYFERGRAELVEKNKGNLVKPLEDVVRRVCRIKPALINSIVLEGHADREGTYRENVWLSAQRAQTVYFEVRTKLDQDETKDVRHCMDSRITVSGRGYVQPKNFPSSKWDAPDRPINDPDDRRVILKIRFTSGGEKLQSPT